MAKDCDEDDQERAGGDDVLVSGEASGGGRGAEEQEQSPLFPNPSFADKRLRCEQYISQIPEKGYNIAHSKAAQMKTRCTRSDRV